MGDIVEYTKTSFHILSLMVVLVITEEAFSFRSVFSSQTEGNQESLIVTCLRRLRGQLSFE